MIAQERPAGDRRRRRGRVVLAAVERGVPGALAVSGIVASADFVLTPIGNERLNVRVFIRDDLDTTVPEGSSLLIYGDVFHGQLIVAR